jgi:hypothetical protein
MLDALLTFAQKHRLRHVGITDFGQHKHAEMLEQLQDYRMSYPERISIFHLDADDFSDVKTSQITA